jgi:DNA-binding winged helix-turn-helix (wHTH) protein
VLTDTMWLDEHGLLHVGRAWVALSDIEWRIVAALLAHYGEVVAHDDVVQATWPDRRATDSMLNVAMKRTRARVAPLGVTITTVRGRGFVLDRQGPADHRTPATAARPMPA